jgi:hypothetical protein
MADLSGDEMLSRIVRALRENSRSIAAARAKSRVPGTGAKPAKRPAAAKAARSRSKGGSR